MCDVFDSLTDGEHLTRNLPSRKHGLGGDGLSFTHSVSEALQERPVSTYLPLNEVEAPPGFSYSVDSSRSMLSGPRSWPLRDPEEAALLKHYVDRIAIFVSDATVD